MKKIILQITTLLIMICVLVGCGAQNSGDGKKDDRVEVAVEALNKQWDDYQIKNTRIIDLKETDIEMFEGIDYIVEFVLYTDYFGSAPYYNNAGIYDTVSVYADGHAEINKRNLFDVYRSNTYLTDFSDIIQEITDLGAAYNN